MSATREWIIAGAAIVGGVGSAAGGIFAWRAAVASRRTAREARDALANALAPDPLVELDVFGSDSAAASPDDVTLFVRVVNMDRWSATNLELRVTLADGEVVTRRRDQLDSFSGGGGESWFEEVRQVTDTWPPRDVGEPIEVTLRFSDSRDLAGYEQTLTAVLRGTGASGSNSVAIEDEQRFARRELG